MKSAPPWTWLIAVFVVVFHLEIGGFARGDAAEDVGVVTGERAELPVETESEDGDDTDDDAAAVARARVLVGVDVVGPHRSGARGMGPRPGHDRTPDRPPDFG